jgi:hypothetical protein
VGVNHSRIHSIADHTDVSRSIFKPAREFFSDAAAASATAGALPDAWAYHRLDDAATQGFFGLMGAPDDIKNGSSVSMRVVWVANATTSGNVRWSVNTLVLADGANATATGTTTTATGDSTSSKTAAYKYTDNIGTVFSSVSKGDVLRISIRRVGGDGADTFADNIRAMGFWLDYTADQ